MASDRKARVEKAALVLARAAMKLIRSQRLIVTTKSRLRLSRRLRDLPPRATRLPSR